MFLLMPVHVYDILLISVHPKTPNFGFTLSAVSTQLSANVI